jgi:hypothetical protein
MRLYRSALSLCCALGVLLPTRADAPVKFEEVFGLVRSNIVGVSEADLSKAAALGLIEQLKGKVELAEPGATPNASSNLIAKTNTFENSFAYLRVERVASGLAQQMATAVKSSKKPKGLVVDLRFAKGDDYAAAAEAVNAFLNSEQTVLKWGDKVEKTSARTDIIDIPTVVLINRQTRGAAEALAGALKEQQIALLIGGHTAGQALVFDDFPLSNGLPLSNGQHLRIARSKVELANGKPIGTEGVAPDIALDVDEKNERRWLEDPYLPITRANTPAGPAPFLTSVTNRVGRRLNASEVARRHREELEEGDGPAETPRPAEATVPVVQDAALARGLDFLKGLTSTRLRNAR